MSSPRVIVAHPGKQHSPQTALAFQERGLLAGYIAGMWYKPGHMPYSLAEQFFPRLWSRMEPELVRRFYFSPMDPELVVQFPWFQGLRILAKRFLKSGRWDDYFIYLINRSFDVWLVKQLGNKIKGKVLIGYEMSSLQSFLRARALGMTCVLDLAISAWPSQKRIVESENLPINKRFFEKCNRLKQQELQFADAILVGSKQVKASLAAANIDPNKVVIIPYGINKKVFSPKLSYTNRDKLALVFVGAVSIRKGIKYLLEAVRQLAKLNIELTIVGGMDDAATLMEQYKGNYKYYPFMSQAELVEYYQQADVFVFPSLLEGFAQVTIEAMACGTPVIVSDSAGSSDAVIDGVNGFVVISRDVEALKEKILYFYHNRNQIEVMGRAASQTAEDYTWEIYRERLCQTVLDIYRGKSGHPRQKNFP